MILGPDRARFRIRADSENSENNRQGAIDEIEEYWNGCYLSAPEAVWRILGYNITQKTPAVTALPVHLPNSAWHERYHRSNSHWGRGGLETGDYMLGTFRAHVHLSHNVTGG